MATQTATVIDLGSERRARALEEAMRRHPSYQSRTDSPPPPLRAV